MKRTLSDADDATEIEQATAKRSCCPSASSTAIPEEFQEKPEVDDENDDETQRELHLLPASEDGSWLTMDYDGHQLFVHPETKRVCMEIDGDPIGELDLEDGQLVLYGEDNEANGATALTPNPTAEAHLTPSLLADYGKTGLVCLKGTAAGGWLRDGLLEEARREVEVLLAAGFLTSERHQQPTNVRTDKVVYLQLSSDDSQTQNGMSSVSCPPACQEVLGLIEGFASALDRQFSMRLRRPQRCMAACYDGGGAFYKAHRDNDRDSSTGLWKNSRSLTAVFYINDVNWPASEGGALRCHLGGASSNDVLDVLPAGGQLVIFDSRRLLHEVLPTSERRLALTIWFV
eukprot:CAMPEP_0206562430 /NCGR_PEP_ID=MMETSP0325_2-20121206/22227_1 /ASSEMBLY_ACC=CAM_ASM_000347 /TAXON_ID=2866 /ORGANISM="Crypthecodinium cohnii, Strain Seligo" /LENGTH=344 /DNA_ID=CAMNT_0054064605 /DNA_START=312 /DNA_END=1342 /DNA_ORIENTATION=+